jgi:hypothetical protein
MTPPSERCSEVRLRWYETRRAVARVWKRLALGVYEWIWP